MAKLRVLGLCGSLRRESFNRRALKAAIGLAPEDMAIESFDRLGAIPLYDEDVREQGFPVPVSELRAAIARSDALLFVTPEYNYSVPGVLKNAIDWASRPPDQPFDGKPCAIMGASTSMLGSARAQYHLRQTCVFLNMFPVNQPEVMIASAAERFAPDGTLKDDKAAALIRNLLHSLADWTRKIAHGQNA